MEKCPMLLIDNSELLFRVKAARLKKNKQSGSESKHLGEPNDVLAYTTTLFLLEI